MTSFTPPPDSSHRDAVRRALLAARRAADPAARAIAQSALTARLAGVVELEPQQVLAVYWPIRGEPALASLLPRWRATGARLALPVVEGPARPLRFLEWLPQQPLQPGPWNIPQPVGTPVLRPSLILVPCLGFSGEGYRLGYGGGFYDRTLQALEFDGGPVPRTLGIAWDEARLDDFVPLPTDRPLDAVVTPSAVYASGSKLA